MRETDTVNTSTDIHRQMPSERAREYKKRQWQRKRKRRQRRMAALAFLLIVIIAALILLIAHIGRKDNLSGTWAYDETTVYEFDGKGKGSLLLPQGNYEFDYVIDGQSLHIDFLDPSANDACYEYEVDKDGLVMKNTEGYEYRFIKRE